MRKIAIILFCMLFLIGYFSFIPEETVSKEIDHVNTRAFVDFEMDMDIAEAAL